MFPTDMSYPDKCIVSVHAEDDIPRVAVEELLWNVQPLLCVYHAIMTFGKCCIVECCILRVWSGLPWLEQLRHVPLI